METVLILVCLPSCWTGTGHGTAQNTWVINGRKESELISETKRQWLILIILLCALVWCVPPPCWHMLCPERDKWALYADFTPKICPFYAKTLPILQSLATDENTQQGALLTRWMPAKFPVSFSKSSQSSFYHHHSLHQHQSPSLKPTINMVIITIIMEIVLLFTNFARTSIIILHRMTCQSIMRSHEYAKMPPFLLTQEAPIIHTFQSRHNSAFGPICFVGHCHPDPVVAGQTRPVTGHMSLSGAKGSQMGRPDSPSSKKGHNWSAQPPPAIIWICTQWPKVQK